VESVFVIFKTFFEISSNNSVHPKYTSISYKSVEIISAAKIFGVFSHALAGHVQKRLCTV